MKKILVLLLAMALVFSMAACGGGEEEPESMGTLGVVMPNATHGFLGESIAHAKAEADAIAADAGMIVNFLTSAESSEQNNQIDQLIADGVDCIVLWPHNGDEVRSSAQAVMDAGIPLIIYDRLINDFVPTAELMGDNVTIGEMTGEYFNTFFAAEIAEVKVKYGDYRKGDVPHSLASIEKAKNLLNYNPQFSMKDGLKEAVTWYWNNLK